MRVECEKIGLKRSIERSTAGIITALLLKADTGQSKRLTSLPQLWRQTENVIVFFSGGALDFQNVAVSC